MSAIRSAVEKKKATFLYTIHDIMHTHQPCCKLPSMPVAQHSVRARKSTSSWSDFICVYRISYYEVCHILYVRVIRFGPYHEDCRKIHTSPSLSTHRQLQFVTPTTIHNMWKQSFFNEHNHHPPWIYSSVSQPAVHEFSTL
jgi:hypothetical protein